MAAVKLAPLDIWRRTMVDNVRRDAPDLSARQMAVLLTVYMTKPPHTVRGLADILNVSKPAITRALDRLGEFSLARRKTDAKDRRSILVQRTVKGSVYLAEFAEIIEEARMDSEREQTALAARRAQRQARKMTVSAKKAPAAKKQPAAAASNPAAAVKEPAGN